MRTTPVDQFERLQARATEVRRGIQPSWVATGDRSVTQPIALQVFVEGRDGLAWWSTIESSWANVTLFAERALPRVHVRGSPEVLTTGHVVVRLVADRLGIQIGS
jgi:hypothetical protein